MNIDPTNERYSEIYDLGAETEEQRKLFEEAYARGEIVAVAPEKQRLLDLQDALRKAGYKKAR